MNYILTQMYRESSPLGGAGVEIPAVNMQISRTDSLRPKSVEQRHLRAGRDTDWIKYIHTAKLAFILVLTLNTII